MHEKDEATRETVEREVPQEKRNQRVLSDDEIDALMDLGEHVEDHYDEPQDVEWAIVEGDVYMLQSRPIQSAESASVGRSDSSGSGEVLVDGLGSSPGRVSGPAKIVTKLDDLAKVSGAISSSLR